MKEKLAEEFVKNTVGDYDESKEYFLQMDEDGFAIVERDKETGELKEVHLLPCNDYIDYFPTKIPKSRLPMYLHTISLWVLLGLIFILMIGGLICHFGTLP